MNLKNNKITGKVTIWFINCFRLWLKESDSTNWLIETFNRYVHTYTLYHLYRPFGSSVMFACHDKIEGYKLYMVEPSGLTYVKLLIIILIK